MNKNAFATIIFTWALSIIPSISFAQGIALRNDGSQLSKLDDFFAPVQKVLLVPMSEDSMKSNFEGGDKIEFKVIPYEGATLLSEKKPKFMDKGLPIGSNLFKIKSQLNKDLFCETGSSHNLKSCFLDLENDGLFDFECISPTDIIARQATFFPNELRYAVIRIGNCLILKGENKLQYKTSPDVNFEPVDVQIIAEKLPFNQVRVSWEIPTQGGKFSQWGGMIQRTIPEETTEYHFKLGGVIAKVDLTTIVYKQKRFKVSLESYDLSIPMLEIKEKSFYSPFMPQNLLY